MSGTLTDKKRTGAPHGVQSSVIKEFLRTFPRATRSDPSRIVRSLQACTSYHRPFFRRSDRRPVWWRDQPEVLGTNNSMRGLAVGSWFFSRSLPAIARQGDRAVRRTVRRGASKSAARMESERSRRGGRSAQEWPPAARFSKGSAHQKVMRSLGAPVARGKVVPSRRREGPPRSCTRRFRTAVGIPNRGIESFPVVLMAARRLMMISHAVVDA